ncbi:MAG: hypothetical protein KZQ89_20755 [Candidatus Thiodiazotropha sp. (ex Lucinoma kastoroae)]|nr:hypothetical protein [Candidatus Thiodiazotropha sp. (ex Lucinoma kastoroae)]MCU7860801.1 hypothetical protein [Candidatus Thiodiazotropha sp. (ex Lucinoma kastoroae)]
MANRGEEAFSSKRGRPAKDEQSELATLKQEILRLKEENEILKKPPRTLRGNSSEVRIHTITQKTVQDHPYV